MQPYVLGVDIGTGSAKAVAVYFNGLAVNVSQHYYPIKSPKPGYSEQDPKLILQAFINCIADTVIKTGQIPYAISLSSAMHSVILVDSNGKALSDMITWADSRSERIAQNLRNTQRGLTVYETSGTPIHAMAPLCKIIWVRENDPELFAATYKFISIKEFIWYRLFNEFKIDYSIASATGLFDIQNLTWNITTCTLAGITTQQLSEPVNTNYKRAGLNSNISSSLKIPRDTPFIIGASDGCCANLGSFVDKPGIASLTIGTSGAVRITSTTPVFNFEAMLFNYLLNEKTFVCGGAVNNGGVILNWLLKTFYIESPADTSSYEAALILISTVPAGSGGLIFLPYLYGERAPIWDAKSCGVFFNIKPKHTKAHFLRAGLEGICFALNDVLQTLEQSSSSIRQLNISGGFITSSIWIQMLADITGKNLVIAQKEDASALGAAFLGMDAFDITLDNHQHIDYNELNYIPDKLNFESYSISFLIFKQLYRDLKETMHWMHDTKSD